MDVDWYNYFKAKAWALLHDPPNKMWILLGKGRCFEKIHLGTKAHEEDAAELWYEMGLSGLFGDITSDSIAYRLTRDADRLSSSMDRWMLEELGASGQGVFAYSKLHNIFNPKLSKDLPKDINCEEVSKYAGIVSKILGDVTKALDKHDKAEQARAVYHLFYALYELEWIKNRLPPSLADTRVPTHTVFDHNYATATLINMLWPNNDVGGYLVEVDIPGIQRVVNSARKAGDFWAGSWLISMLAWFTVWPLVWDYGPDIVIKPTLRLNPIYHVTLGRKLNQLGSSLGETLLGEVGDFYGHLIFETSAKVDDWMLLGNPIIPGTIILLLPADVAGSEGELRDKVMQSFTNAQQCLTEWALTGTLSGSCGDAKAMLSEVPGEDHAFLRLVNGIYNDLKDTGVFNDLIQVRVNTVNLRDVYDCLGKYVSSGGNVLPGECTSKGVVKGGLIKVDAFLKLIGQLRAEGYSDLANRLSGELSRYLAFDVGLTALGMKARIEGRRRLIVGKPWFNRSGVNTVSKPLKSNVDPYGEYVFHDRSNVGYIYCSVCGDEPAIVHLRRDPGNPNDYDKSTKDKVLAKFNVNPEELNAQVRPGEALGPLCLIKRATYYRFKRAYGGIAFDSTEDIAFAWYTKIYNGLKASLHGKCDRFNYYLTSDLTGNVKDITILCGHGPECNAERASRLFNDCAAQLLEVHSGEFLGGLMRDLGVTKYSLEWMRPDPSVISFRSYYAVIRGDADDVGKLSRGELPLGNYREFLEDLMKQPNLPNDTAKAYGVLINLFNILEELGKKEGGLKDEERIGVVVTPTYNAALSMALIITALRDIKTVNFRYYTNPVMGLMFSGGDDVLALAPVEVSLSIVRDLRSNYWGGGGGFHELANGGYFIAAPKVVGFGRSFSLRFANITDVMSEEVREAVNMLEDVAKKATWSLNGKELRKDSLVISESRTGRSAILPFSDPAGGGLSGALDLLNELFVLRLGGVLSGSIPEDYAEYGDAVNTLVRGGCSGRLMDDIWLYVVDRNVKVRGIKEDVKRNLSLDALSRLHNMDPCGRATFKNCEPRGTNIISELVKAYEVLRGYP